MEIPVALQHAGSPTGETRFVGPKGSGMGTEEN
jgi:hypothetical protein